MNPPSCPPPELKYLEALLDERFKSVHESIARMEVSLNEIKGETAKNSEYRIQSMAVISLILLLVAPVFIDWVKSLVLK